MRRVGESEGVEPSQDLWQTTPPPTRTYRTKRTYGTAQLRSISRHQAKQTPHTTFLISLGFLMASSVASHARCTIVLFFLICSSGFC